MKRRKTSFNDGWCFAVVNGGLAEIHFRHDIGIIGHCYVKRSEYTKKEQRMINVDIKTHKFRYRKGYYTDQLTGFKHKPNLKKFRQELRLAEKQAIPFSEIKKRYL